VIPTAHILVLYITLNICFRVYVYLLTGMIYCTYIRIRMSRSPSPVAAYFIYLICSMNIMEIPHLVWKQDQSLLKLWLLKLHKYSYSKISFPISMTAGSRSSNCTFNQFTIPLCTLNTYGSFYINAVQISI
jgi:hypothetical protein